MIDNKFKTVFVYAFYVVSIVVFVYATVVSTATVNGNSMSPSLSDKDIIITSKLDLLDTVGRGKIVVCKYPNDNNQYIKRVVAVAGDKVEIKKGHLYINERDRTEMYYQTIVFDNDYKEHIVAEDSVFVIGDNINDSYDSRSVGDIKKSNIQGIVLARIFPKMLYV